MKILHVAAIDLLPNSGMGRISYEWKSAFERAGHYFSHIGPKELGRGAHPLFFGWHVRKYILKNKIKPDVILAHEPTSGFMHFNNVPLVVYSHGVEERAWNVQNQYGFFKPSFKSRCVPVSLRFYSNNNGFKKCAAALLSNNEDYVFLNNQKHIRKEKLHIFHNGYYLFDKKPVADKNEGITFLYNASWISRKGIYLMYEAFNDVLEKYSFAKLILAGTGSNPEEVLQGFNKSIHPQIKIIKSFKPEEEADLYKTAQVFVMPSYFEGQSLALTQSMAMGLCPIVSDNCGQKDFVKHEKNGLLFKTGDSNDLKNKLKYLLQNSEQINKWGSHAKQSVQSLTWPHVSDHVVKICESV